MERLSCKHWMQAELLHFMHMLMSDMLQCMTFEVTDDIYDLCMYHFSYSFSEQFVAESFILLPMMLPRMRSMYQRLVELELKLTLAGEVCKDTTHTEGQGSMHLLRAAHRKTE